MEDQFHSLPIHHLCGNAHVNEDSALEVLKMFMEAAPLSVGAIDEIGFGGLPIHYAAKSRQSADFSALLIDAYPEGVKIESIDGYANPPKS